MIVLMLIGRGDDYGVHDGGHSHNKEDDDDFDAGAYNEDVDDD